jgi:esterase/lipase superfamily enzyme
LLLPLWPGVHPDLRRVFLTPTTATALGATEHSLLVATTRERDARPGALFSSERSGVLHYAAITVSVPPIHASGELEWPSTQPGNPNTDFVVGKAEYLNGDREFIRALNTQLAMRPRGSRKVMIFVHGFNTLFSEGLTVEAFRQIAIEGRIPRNEKLGSVFLAAPDIDLDVFKSELRQFPEPRRPFYVILSKDDQALQISSLIAGGKSRLGSDGNTSELAAVGATVIDLTDINAMDPVRAAKVTFRGSAFQRAEFARVR